MYKVIIKSYTDPYIKDPPPPTSTIWGEYETEEEALKVRAKLNKRFGFEMDYDFIEIAVVE